MKNVVLVLMIGLISLVSNAQTDSTSVADNTVYKITLVDGQKIIGKIIKEDERELLIRTEDGRQFYIPSYKFKSKEPVTNDDYNQAGEYVGEDPYATRYFLTTNGLPVKKGDNYIQWNVYGPDFQFGVGDNFGIGVMTTWIGAPILLNAKYSFQLGEKAQFAVGAVGGSGSWLAPDWGGVLPFGTLSFGTRRANIAFSGGYGAIWSGYSRPDGRALASVAGMVKIGKRASFVFDSFILLPNTRTVEYNNYNYQTGQTETYTNTYQTDLLAFFTPGVRWHLDNGNAFQFGLTGMVYDDWLIPAPIPTIQYYVKL